MLIELHIVSEAVIFEAENQIEPALHLWTVLIRQLNVQHGRRDVALAVQLTDRQTNGLCLTRAVADVVAGISVTVV